MAGGQEHYTVVKQWRSGFAQPWCRNSHTQMHARAALSLARSVDHVPSRPLRAAYSPPILRLFVAYCSPSYAPSLPQMSVPWLALFSLLQFPLASVMRLNIFKGAAAGSSLARARVLPLDKCVLGVRTRVIPVLRCLPLPPLHLSPHVRRPAPRQHRVLDGHRRRRDDPVGAVRARHAGGAPPHCGGAHAGGGGGGGGMIAPAAGADLRVVCTHGPHDDDAEGWPTTRGGPGVVGGGWRMGH